MAVPVFGILSLVIMLAAVAGIASVLLWIISKKIITEEHKFGKLLGIVAAVVLFFWMLTFIFNELFDGFKFFRDYLLVIWIPAVISVTALFFELKKSYKSLSSMKALLIIFLCVASVVIGYFVFLLLVGLRHII
jgi:hypothetical protein